MVMAVAERTILTVAELIVTLLKPLTLFTLIAIHSVCECLGMSECVCVCVCVCHYFKKSL